MEKTGVSILTVYVDNLLPTRGSSDTLLRLMQTLMQKLETSDVGEASLVLGMEYKRDREAKTLTI